MTATENTNNETQPGVEGQPVQLPASTAMPDFTAYNESMLSYDARRAGLVPSNKAALFAALESAGIHTVVVMFDGSGDQGQIESIEAFTADNEPIDLPGQPIEHRTAVYDKANVDVEHIGIREMIDTMAYDFLDQAHSGWGNEDGAYGKFTFTVADQSVSLDYNERYTESTNYQHEF